MFLICVNFDFNKININFYIKLNLKSIIDIVKVIIKIFYL